MFWAYLLSRFSFRVLYRLADVLTWLFLHIFPYRKSVVLENLRHSFPEKSEAERRHIMRKFYLHMAYLLVEWIKLVTLPKEDFMSRMQLHIPEDVQRVLASQSSLIFYTGHVGNWEWALAHGSACLPLPVVALVRRLLPTADRARQRAPRGMFIRQVLDKVRQRFGIESYAVQDAKRYFRYTRQHTAIYAIAGDLRPNPQDPVHWCSLFGREAAFFQGIERLPRLLNAPAVFVEILCTQKGHYRSTLRLLATPPYAPYDKNQLQILPLYVSALEHAIRQNPSDWLWSHRRWRRTHKAKRPA